MIRYDPVVVEGAQLVVYPDLYRRGAVHPEAVYQALLAAGYDVSALGRREVAEFVARARRTKGILKVGVVQAFGDRVRPTAARA